MTKKNEILITKSVDNIKTDTLPFSRDEVNNIIRREANQETKWYDIKESSVLRIQPTINLYLQALDASLDKRLQNRNLLYDFYLNTLIVDDVVSSLIDKRLNNINNKSIQIVNTNNEIIEDYQYFLEAPKFRKFMEDIVLSKFWGFNLFGFKQYDWNNKKWFDYVQVPHKHVDPYNECILENQFSSSPVKLNLNGKQIEKYSEHPDFLFVGDKDDLGLLSKITKLSIQLRQGDFWYAKYADLASENFTQVKKKGLVDEKVLQEISKRMSKRSGGAILTTDDNIDLSFDNQSSSQQNQLYENYNKEKRDRLAILILGQTMTTTDGSSRAQAEVHETEQDDKYSADEQLVLDVLNYEFIDYMKLWFPDFNIADKRFVFIPKTTDEVQKKLNYYKMLKDLGVEFNSDELKDKFKDIL